MQEAKKRGLPGCLDAILVFLAATAMAAAVVALKPVCPFLRGSASVVVAFLFILSTAAAVRLRGEDISLYGFDARGWRGEALTVVVLCAVIFPVYFLGFGLYWHPPRPFHFALAVPLWQLALNNLLVVALPEELLFRGYIQQRLGTLLTKRVRVLGFSLGWHIPAAALLFALGHIATGFNPNRLATFFPALVFGALKERRGSLIGCTLFHAACNIFSEIVVRGYYR